MLKYFITSDPFYDIDRYNDTLMALKNNNIEYEEFISTKPPYNWFINTNHLPIYINYELANSNSMRFLVTKVKPLRANEEYILKRRETDGSGASALTKFIYNDVFKNVKNKYVLCFRYKSKSELFELSTKIPNTKIYTIGTYKGRTLAITYNKYIQGELNPSYIITEKPESELNGLGEFEMEINYKGLKKKDKILKYTETAYIENGKYYPVKINK